MSIRLIVGLGNPGPEYEYSRHNVGFHLVNKLAHNIGLKYEARFHAQVAKMNMMGQEIWLLEPQTYMNRSGQAVNAFMRFYKLTSATVLVVHDELDLDLGVAKLKENGSAAGHNGLKSITAALGTQVYWRLRLGIGHPRRLGLQQAVENFVLKRPHKQEQILIDEAIARSIDIIPLLCHGQFAEAMMQLHTNNS